MILNATRIGRDICPDKLSLQAFHDGLLHHEEEEAIAEHLGSCATCLAAIETILEHGQQVGIDAQLRYALLQTEDIEMPPGVVSTAPSRAEDRMVGHYRLKRELGQGGMGIVYLAEDHRGSAIQPVALKMLRPALAPAREHVERFRNEVAAVQRLKHPNIVSVFEVGEHDNQPYFTMEYVPGETLAAHIARGRLPANKAARLLQILAEAVHQAHEQNVLHRDLKPANVLIETWDHPRIVDFGLAKIIDDEDTGLTMTDMVLGTPAYMAPEQAAGQRSLIGRSTDVYSLGAILYACLTGKPVFEGTYKLEILEHVRTRSPQPPSQRAANIPPDLEAICLRCLEKAPQRRYATAKDLADDLARFNAGKRPKAAPSMVQRGWHALKQAAIPIGLALLMVAFSGGMYWFDPSRAIVYAESELQHGRPVLLLTAKRPTPYVVRAGEASTKVTQNADGSLTVASWGRTTLVEIMPQMPTDRYQFRARIRHDNSDFSGRVGLYVVHAKALGTTPEGYQTYAGLAYNDLRRASEVAPMLPPRVGQQVAFQPTNPAYVGFGSVGDRADGGRWEGFPNDGAALRFLPNGYPSDWRTVQLQVAPDGITAWWDGQKVGHYPQKQFLSTFQNEWLDQQNRVPNDVYLPLIKPMYNTRGGLGLIVFQGSATFKDVELVPQSE